MQACRTKLPSTRAEACQPAKRKIHRRRAIKQAPACLACCTVAPSTHPDAAAQENHRLEALPAVMAWRLGGCRQGRPVRLVRTLVANLHGAEIDARGWNAQTVQELLQLVLHAAGSPDTRTARGCGRCRRSSSSCSAEAGASKHAVEVMQLQRAGAPVTGQHRWLAEPAADRTAAGACPHRTGTRCNRGRVKLA